MIGVGVIPSINQVLGNFSELDVEVLGGTAQYVERLQPNQIGDGKYFPHLTVGVDTFEHLKIIEAEPFDSFTVRPASVAVYHLGNNGTARKLHKAWPVSNSWVP